MSSSGVAETDTLSFAYCKKIGIDCTTSEFPKDIDIDREKEIILTKIMEKTKPPYHNLVQLWNLNTDFLEKPADVEIVNYKTISNAWIITPAVMPSVNYNNVYYIGDSGIVLTSYNYSLSIPENYVGTTKTCDKNPVVNELNDCKTLYTGNTDETTLSIYQNNVLIGNNRVTEVNSEDSNSFESVLSIKNAIDIKHYKWDKTGKCCQYKSCCFKVNNKKVCRRDKRCGCDINEKECRFNSNDKKTDELELKSSFYAAKENAILPQDNNLIIDSSGIQSKAQLSINTNSLVSYQINYETQIIKKEYGKYKLNHIYAPQNILFVSFINNEKLYTENAKINYIKKTDISEILSFAAEPAEPETCKILLDKFFSASISDCNIMQLSKSSLLIETDKWFYAVNDTIKLKLYFTNPNNEKKTIAVSYSNQSIIDETTGEIFEAAFIPDISASLITAQLQGTSDYSSSESSALITVYDNSDYAPLVWAVFIIIFMYLGYRLIIKGVK
ncbi:MAG: hypothetical protein V1859_02210 [archaeon]